MLVQADKVFVTASPLSELVWSPRKGLGLKCTDSSSAANRTSLWWSTDSFNVIFSAPVCDSIKEGCDDVNLAEGTLSSLQLVPNSSGKKNMDATSLGQMVSASLAMTNKHRSISCQELGMPQGTSDVFLDINHPENNQFDSKELEPSACRNNQADVDMMDTDAKIVNNFSNSEGACINTDKVELNCGQSRTRNFLEHSLHAHEKKNQSAQLLKGPTKQTSTLKCHDLSDKLTYATKEADSIDVRRTFADDMEEDAKKKELSFFKQFLTHRIATAEVGSSKAHEPIKDNIQNTFPKEKNSGIESSSNRIVKDLNQKRGKEKIINDAENAAISKKTGSSHESVESSNSKEFPAKKRAWCNELVCDTWESKRLKKQNNGTSYSSPFLGRDSSFMNWISSMATGFSTSIPTETAMALAVKSPESAHGNSCPHMSPDKNNDTAYRTMGFQTFIQALGRPRSENPQILAEKNQAYDHRFDGAKGSQMTNKSSGSFLIRMLSNGCEPKMQQPVPISSLNGGQSHLGEFPATATNSPSAETLLIGNFQSIISEKHVTNNWVSSSTSMQNASPIADKENGIPINLPNKSANGLSRSSGNEFLGSFWISRLCQKEVPAEFSAQCNQIRKPEHDIQAANYVNLQQTQGESNKFLKNKAHDNVKEGPSPMDSSSSKKLASDEKLVMFNPIMPSHRLQKLEPMASIFSKRIDAFRHAKTPHVTDDVVSMSTCFFCGQSGHNLKTCLEIKGSELEGLQKSINSYDGTQKSVCFCIRCFQSSHWAVACPLLVRKSRPTCANMASTSDAIPINGDIVSSDCVRHVTPEKGLNFGFMQNMNTVAADNRRFNAEQTEEVFSKGSLLKEKQLVTCSEGVNSSRNKIPLQRSIENMGVLGDQKQLFEVIRGLRLSRSELTRGWKSLGSYSSFDGFFLRIRLGKCEGGGIKGSGYQVACICGEALENSNGSCKSLIAVKIGDLKYSIDPRFVSNDDFQEDELNAWWSAIIQGGGELPTGEELTKKLLERSKFGF